MFLQENILEVIKDRISSEPTVKRSNLLLSILLFTQILGIVVLTIGSFPEPQEPMTKGLIDTLLQIGNVETNPGPTVEKKEVVDEILTSLISTAPNDEMKILFTKITTLNNKN